MPGGRPGRPRICWSWAWAAICWEKMAAWMPWNRPSSQPTSWAWATRSSESLGVSAENGELRRASSALRSPERPSASSRTDVS